MAADTTILEKANCRRQPDAALPQLGPQLGWAPRRLSGALPRCKMAPAAAGGGVGPRCGLGGVPQARNLGASPFCRFTVLLNDCHHLSFGTDSKHSF